MDQNPQFDIKNINFNFNKINFKSLGIIAIAIIVAVILFSSWFTVKTDSVGVVLRFGKYVRIAGPGLNFKLPYGIEKVYDVPVQRQLKLEFGFRSVLPGMRTQYSEKGYKSESLMLTGDLNAVVVQWIVQYRIDNPYDYLFKVKDPTQVFRNMNEAVMRSVVGDRTVDEVLTVGRQEVAATATKMLQKLSNQYGMGIRVAQVVLQDVMPPEQVKPAFNAVNEAQQEKAKLINQALANYNRAIPKAKGKAAQTIQIAKGYAINKINRAKGNADRFDKFFNAYMTAKNVTYQRIYLNTMADILSKAKKVISDGKATTLPILPLKRLLQNRGEK
ncbi:MAG: FtsH protease activity modulator HflK [Epsilonproteobacteria bacterium]|nr:FtsH protease activity modulator HflK [Campylobacterota bacterium]